MKKFSKSEMFEACETCLKDTTVSRPDCIKGEIYRSGGDIEPPECMRPFLSGLLSESQRATKAQKDKKSLTPYEKSLTPYEDGRNKIVNYSQNSTFRQPNSSMGSMVREDRKKHQEELDLKILKLITYMYHVSMIARLLNKARTTIIYRLKKLEGRRLIKPDGKSNARSYPKFYFLTSKGTEVLIQYEGGSSAYDPPFRYEHHAIQFKSELLSGARPKGDHTYHPRNWDGEVFYFEDYKIRLTSKHAIVDIQQDISADTEANLLLKYHTLAQNYLQKFSAQHNIQLSPIVEYNREPHRTIPGSHDLAQELLGSIGGELHDTKIGLQIDESDKDHKGEVEFIGKKGAEVAANFLHLVNQGPTILAKTNAKVDELDKKFDMKIDEVEAKADALTLAIFKEQENQKLRAQNEELQKQAAERSRIQEYGNQSPNEKSKYTYSGVEFG